MTNPAPAPDQRIGHLDHTQWATAAGRWLASLATPTHKWSQANAVLAVTLAVALATVVGALKLAGELYEAVAANDGIAAIDPPLLSWILSVRTTTANGYLPSIDTGGSRGSSRCTGSG